MSLQCSRAIEFGQFDYVIMCEHLTGFLFMIAESCDVVQSSISQAHLLRTPCTQAYKATQQNELIIRVSCVSFVAASFSPTMPTQLHMNEMAIPTESRKFQ